MTKSKRAGRAAPARHRTTSGLAADRDTGRKAAAPRAVPASARERFIPSMEAPGEDALDEWLAQDEDGDADLDQWLHEHGADGSREG